MQAGSLTTELATKNGTSNLPLSFPTKQANTDCAYLRLQAGLLTYYFFYPFCLYSVVILALLAFYAVQLTQFWGNDGAMMMQFKVHSIEPAPLVSDDLKISLSTISVRCLLAVILTTPKNFWKSLFVISPFCLASYTAFTFPDSVSCWAVSESIMSRLSPLWAL